MEPKFGKMELFVQKPGMVKLPEKKEMLKRLEEVVGESPEFQEHLYPLLTRHAGKTVAPEGVALNLATAFRAYEQNAPTEKNGRTEDLWRQADTFIDALVSNKEAAKKAKRTWEIIRAEES